MEIVAPPWHLTGSGLIMLYRFPRAFVAPWLAPELRDAYRGGIGAVICVDYATANVGPYRELLLIPGGFRWRGRIDYSISRIFVSTLASLVSGQANWAIPKQLASFDVGPRLHLFRAIVEGEPFFRVDASAYGPYLPLRTSWSPLQPAIIQQDERGFLRTQPAGRAALRLAHIRNVAADGVHFPDVGQFRPLLAVFAHNFELTFPLPEAWSRGQGSGSRGQEPDRNGDYYE